MPLESLTDFHEKQKKFVTAGGRGFILVYQ
jgi:hypothetical protein